MVKRKIAKADLIDQAAFLFRTRGYANTSIADLADAVGLSKASIYHYISNKHELVTMVTKNINQYFTNHIFICAYQKDLSAKQRFAQLFDKIKAFYSSHQGNCVISNLVSELNDTHPEFNPLFQHFFNEWIAAFEHLYSEVMPKEQAKEYACDTFSHIQGSLLFMRLYKDDSFFARAEEKLLAVFDANKKFSKGESTLTA